MYSLYIRCINDFWFWFWFCVTNLWERRKENCSNYRPISLLCIVSKVLERALLNQIKSEILPLITQFQHGFLGGRSTETQLLHVYNYINSILDSSGHADIIYLDFSKAFDSVPHHLLLHKLRSFGFNGSLYQWFSSLASLVVNSVLSLMVNIQIGAMSHQEYHKDLY